MNLKSSKQIILLLTALVAAVMILYFHNKLTPLLAFLRQIEDLPWPQSLIYFSGIFIFSTMFFIPAGLPLTLFAGMLWGTWWGGLIVNLLTVFVAGLCFLIARLLKRGINFDDRERFKKFREIFRQHDWHFIFVARINPIVPFTLSNYLFGLIPDLTFKRYITATLLANLIPCFAFASVGSALGTFSIENPDAQSLIIKLTLMLFFLSLLLAIKWFLTSSKSAAANI